MELFCRQCGSRLVWSQKKAGSNSELAVEPCEVCSPKEKPFEFHSGIPIGIPSGPKENLEFHPMGKTGLIGVVKPVKPIEKKVVTIPNVPKKKK